MRLFDPLPPRISDPTRHYLDYLRAYDGPLTGDVNPERERRLQTFAASVVPLRPHALNDALLAMLRRLYGGESYAVSVLASEPNKPPVVAYVAHQESYHTRLLAVLLTMLGHAPGPPPQQPLLLRPLLRALVRLPAPLSAMLLFIGELVGVLLLDAARRFLSRDPRQHLAVALLEDILVDELGHLSYNHSQLSRRALRFTSWMALPLLWLARWREPLVAERLEHALQLDWSELPIDLASRAWIPALELDANVRTSFAA